MPTPGSFVLALQLQGSAAPARETTGNLTALLGEASPLTYFVLAVLLLFSVASWAIVLYKAWAFRRIERQTATFLDVCRRSTKFSEVQAVCKSLEGSPLVGMFQAGYAELNLQLRHAGTGGSPESAQARPTLKSLAAVDRALLRASSSEVTKLEKRVPFLATTASITPFIGLFGTVVGIMNSFTSIAASKNTSLAVVAPGIAEALFATAIGLFAAIPAVLAYNKLQSEVGKLQTRLEGFADEFSAILSRQIDERIGHAGRPPANAA